MSCDTILFQINYALDYVSILNTRKSYTQHFVEENNTKALNCVTENKEYCMENKKLHTVTALVAITRQYCKMKLLIQLNLML